MIWDRFFFGIISCGAIILALFFATQRLSKIMKRINQAEYDITSEKLSFPLAFWEDAGKVTLYRFLLFSVLPSVIFIFLVDIKIIDEKTDNKFIGCLSFIISFLMNNKSIKYQILFGIFCFIFAVKGLSFLEKTDLKKGFLALILMKIYSAGRYSIANIMFSLGTIPSIYAILMNFISFFPYNRKAYFGLLFFLLGYILLKSFPRTYQDLKR